MMEPHVHANKPEPYLRKEVNTMSEVNASDYAPPPDATPGEIQVAADALAAAAEAARDAGKK